MADTMSITPEKVKNLLSSFLVSPTQSNDRTQRLSGAISIQQNTGDADKTRKATVSSSNSTSVLRSHEKFLERLDTFSALTWFAKPLDVSPIICARYGWENVDSDMLQCVGCKAFLCGQLPSKTDPEAYEGSVSELKKNLLASHDKFCVLAVNPCPEYFCHVPVDDPVSLLSGFSERATTLIRVQDRLPRIDESDLQALGYDAGQGGAYCKRHLLPNCDLSPEAATLAFTGWTCSSSNKDVLMCSMCRRQIGLWNFASSCPLSVSRESSKDSDSDNEQEDEQPKAKRRKISLTKKQSFNPIEEHHHWCPWTKKLQVPSVPSSSSSESSTPTRQQATPTRQQADTTELPQLSVPACLAALRTIAPGLMDNNTGLATTIKTSPMVEGLRCFRRVIKTWSSPKVQTSTSSSASS